MSHRLAGYKLVTHSEYPHAPPRYLFVLIKGVSTAISRHCNEHTSRQTHAHTHTHAHTQTRPTVSAFIGPQTLFTDALVLRLHFALGEPYRIFCAVCWWSLQVSCELHCQGKVKNCKRATLQRKTSHFTRMTTAGIGLATSSIVCEVL